MHTPRGKRHIFKNISFLGRTHFKFNNFSPKKTQLSTERVLPNNPRGPSSSRHLLNYPWPPFLAGGPEKSAHFSFCMLLLLPCAITVFSSVTLWCVTAARASIGIWVGLGQTAARFSSAFSTYTILFRPSHEINIWNLWDQLWLHELFF